MIDQIAKRASVRRFKDEPVSAEAVTELLRAAMAAPSGGNQQPWEFYVVRACSLRRPRRRSEHPGTQPL